MLLDLRDGIRNSKVLKYLLVGIICVPLALVSITSYIGHRAADYAAKVNGEKVSLRAFDNAYRQAQAQVQQTFGGRLPQGIDLRGMIGGQAMDNVVRQEVLRQTTSNGFAVSDDDLANEILSVPAFAEDGVFNKDRYTRQLQSMGLSPEQFEVQYRSDVIMQQLSDGVVATGFALGDEKALEAKLQNQQRKLELLTLDTQAKAETIEVTDDEITAHYEENTANFNNPQKVKVEYIELNADSLKADIEVTEEKLQAHFEDNKNRWVAPEQRSVSHILLELDSDASDAAATAKIAEASAIAARIKAGESLATLATTLSDDPTAENGGSLGEFGRGVMESAFDEVAFSLAEGEVGDPVRTEFGVHVIQVDKIIAEQGQAFAEVRDEVEDQYRSAEAEAKFFEVSNDLSNATYENEDSLQPAADATGLEIQTSDWIDQNTSDGLGAYPAVLAAALTDNVKNNNRNSEVLTVGENHNIVVRTIEHQEATPKEIDEVREDIVQRLKTEKSAAELDTLADKIIEEWQGGAEGAALATTHTGEHQTDLTVGRTSPDLDRAVLQELFRMPKPTDGASFVKVTDTAGNIAVVRFDGVADDAAVEAEDASAEAATAQAPAFSEFNAMVMALQDAADIERNDALLSAEEAY